jgi:uncharacterized protein YlzI (FlbEa/FlbD family)
MFIKINTNPPYWINVNCISKIEEESGPMSGGHISKSKMTLLDGRTIVTTDTVEEVLRRIELDLQKSSTCFFKKIATKM